MGSILPIFALAIVTGYFLMSDVHFDPKSVEGRRVLITGASSGIGEQLCYEYAKLGARIVLSARKAKELQEVAKKCNAVGAAISSTTKLGAGGDSAPAVLGVVVADMGRPEDWKRLVDETRAILKKDVETQTGSAAAGRPHLDYLILNHATIDRKWWSADRMDDLEWTFRVNFQSFVAVATQAMDLLLGDENQKDSKEETSVAEGATPGSIVVVSSGCGKMPCPKMAPYGASKFALHGFFSTWRQEMRFLYAAPPSITTVVLGFIKTKKALELMADDPNARKFDVTSGEDPAEAAAAIVKGVSSKSTQEMYFPRKMTNYLWAHRMFPGFLENWITDLYMNSAEEPTTTTT